MAAPPAVVVAVTRLWKHPKYQKVIKKRSKIMAHAEYDEYNASSPHLSPFKTPPPHTDEAIH